MPPQDQVVTGSYLPSQGEFISSGSEPAAYAAGLSMPADRRYAVIPEQSETQAAPSEINWFVPPPNFEETTHIQPDDASIVGPSVPQAPIPQPGEASNSVKEAELGNYEQLTEHFGFPASNVGPVQGFQYAVPDFHGLWENPFLYPEFDYMLIYGLYPPGTYSTFSQHHEKGKEHSQEVHYLKEHGLDSPQNPEPGQQKLFPRTP
ncbi:PREDICTED: uncharacterized protein LOC107101022 [Cyprinodon variegatus]|uniref:uncharacterized protein LOC107101022 n=1 Tax=Cyprinodon variegatus TaxID=28743 RepID=UPI0007429B46|nr:PREDICTED: uncharacterized protein LOC107101022 [Cyprinodon variegatus]